MLDTTSENNNRVCEISEVPKIKVQKKKTFHKNVLPEITEEEAPINEEMEIKSHNV